MSSRAQPDNAQFKIWPPSAAEIQLLQQKMAPTASSSSNRHRTTDYTLSSNSKRHNSRPAVPGDPLRPMKSTTTSKPKSSTQDFLSKPSSSRSQPPQQLPEPRARVSSTHHRDGTVRSSKSSKSKPPQDPYAAYAVPLAPPPPAPPPQTVWPPQQEIPAEAPRKHRSKDRDRDKTKVKDRDKPRFESEVSRELSKDPYEQRPAVYNSASLGRNFKAPTDNVPKQPKTSSSHRRYHTEEDAQRHPSTEQPSPTPLPNQAPQTLTTSTAMPQAGAQGPDISRTRSRENRSYSPPPAPLVAPVWLPDRDKARKSHKSQDRMASANQQSGPSGSDTEKEQRGHQRSHNRELSSQENLTKASHKKESKMSLSGWFSRKAPKFPMESPAMPTPASVFFSPLPERAAPTAHLVSLKAGEGPADHPYMYQEPLNKTPGTTNNALYPPQESTSRRHHRAQSASVVPSSKAPANSSQDPNAGVSRSHTTQAVGSQSYTNGQAIAQQHSAGAQTPLVQSNHTTLPSRSHAPRYQTPTVAPSTLPVEAPPRSHQRHATVDGTNFHGYSNDHSSKPLEYASANIQPSRSQAPVIQPVQSNGTIAPPRRSTTPAISSLPTLSQLLSPRPKPIIPPNSSSRARHETLPQGGRRAEQQSQATYGMPSDASANNYGSSNQVTSKHGGQSSHPEPEPRQYVDLYPPGYATSAPIPSSSKGGHESRKRKKSKSKRSPQAQAATIVDDHKHESPKHSARAAPQASWSAAPNLSTPSPMQPEGDGHGVSSVLASPGTSAASIGTPTQALSANAAPSAHPGRTSGVYDTSYAQHSGSRPSKPSPESYLTVPIHSTHPSPSRKGNRLVDTPSSTSTVIQPNTPRTKASHSPLKEALLQPPEARHPPGYVSSGHSPSRSQEHLAAVKGTSTPVAAPAEMSHRRSRSYTHEHGPREIVPVRSNTDFVTRRTSTASLQAGVPLQGVQSPQPNVRSAIQDPYGGQYMLSPPQSQSTEALRAPQMPAPTPAAPTTVHQSSRSRKRHDSSNAIEYSTDPPAQNSRNSMQPQAAAPSSRPRREKPPPLEPASYSTTQYNDVQPPLYRTTSNNDNYISSSSHLISNSRTSPNVQANVSLPYSSSSPNLASTTLPPSSNRHHSYQPANVGRSARPSASPIGHSRTLSEPGPGLQPARVAVSGHLSTPAPTADQLPPPTPAQEAELLRTPSSLTAPTLKAQNSNPSRPPSTQSSHEAKKKGGLFNLFRSMSSSAKQRDVPAPAPPPAPAPNPVQSEPRPAKLRRPSNPKYKLEDLEGLKSPGSSTTRVIALPPIAPSGHHSHAATATMAPYPNEKRGPPVAKGFHPWKLLSKRDRTMSLASVEALDGTGLGIHITPDGSSVRSSATSGIYPPIRDPMLATQEWRNQEEMDLVDRGTYRRRRPGVTFEGIDDNTSEPRSKPPRSTRLR